MAEMNVKGFFESLAPRLNADPSRLTGIDAVYQFHVGEESYHVAVRDGKATVTEGNAPAPSCTVTMAQSDFLDLLGGKLNSQMAFMTGKLKVAGDMGQALKLGSFLKV